MDHDAQMTREHRRQQVVGEAIRRADEVILEASDGTTEMTDLLTAQMAEALVAEAMAPANGNLIRFYFHRLRRWSKRFAWPWLISVRRMIRNM